MIWFILLNTVASSIMSGIIWFVQVVHYPLFKSVSNKNFIDYQSKHVKLTGDIVGPFMLMELVLRGVLILVGEKTSAIYMWEIT